MGMSKLPEIVSLFQLAGKQKMSVGIIQNGTTANEKSVFGTVDSILEKVKENNMADPAIIVIGEVVKEAITQIKIYQTTQKNLFPIREAI